MSFRCGVAPAIPPQAPSYLTKGRHPTSNPHALVEAVDEAEEPLVYPVPDESAERLMEFINEMATQEPKGETENERTEDLGHRMQSRIKAAEIVMQGEKAETYAGLAARMKLESLRVLANIGREGKSETFLDYAQSLANSQDETLARVGRFGLFQSKIDAVMMSPDADPHDGCDCRPTTHHRRAP